MSPQDIEATKDRVSKMMSVLKLRAAPADAPPHATNANTKPPNGGAAALNVPGTPTVDGARPAAATTADGVGPAPRRSLQLQAQQRDEQALPAAAAEAGGGGQDRISPAAPQPLPPVRRQPSVRPDAFEEAPPPAPATRRSSAEQRRSRPSQDLPRGRLPNGGNGAAVQQQAGAARHDRSSSNASGPLAPLAPAALAAAASAALAGVDTGGVAAAARNVSFALKPSEEGDEDEAAEGGEEEAGGAAAGEPGEIRDATQGTASMVTAPEADKGGAAAAAAAGTPVAPAAQIIHVLSVDDDHVNQVRGLLARLQLDLASTPSAAQRRVSQCV